MTLQAANFADHVIGTSMDRGKGRVSQIAQELRDYPTAMKLLKRKRRWFKSGRGAEVQLFDEPGTSDPFIGLLEPAQPEFEDHLTQMTTAWVHAREMYPIEYISDVLMNRGEDQITDIKAVRKAAAKLRIIKGIEDRAWSSPAVGNTKYPRGIPYWVVPNATEGFTGGYEGSHTSKGGVDVTVHPNFKNWASRYVNVTNDDLVLRMRRAFKRINWRSPVDLNEYRGQEDRQILLNTETTLSLESLARKNNDSLGGDLGMYDGSTVFKRIPLTDVPKLDSDSTNPCYMLDWGSIKFMVLRGNFFRESSKDGGIDQPDVKVFFTHLSFNILCYDLRRQAIINTA